MAIFSEAEMQRYARHFSLKSVDFAGQRKLKAGKVLCVGAGGLGSPALLYLAAAGVGTLGIAEGDVVDASNLQRQILHFTPDIGRSKIDSAQEKIGQINPHIQVNRHAFFLNAENILSVIKDYDFIIDGSDNFATKFLVNDACIMAHKPFCHAGILRFEGQVMTVMPRKSRCYRCLFREPPPAGAVMNCAEAGVLGAIAGTIGSIQATEALKFLLGIGELLTDRLLIYDALDMRFRENRGSRDPLCAVCGDSPTIKQLIDYDKPACAT